MRTTGTALPQDKIAHVKKAVYVETEIAVDQQVLSTAAMGALPDQRTVGDLAIDPGETIHLAVRQDQLQFNHTETPESGVL